MSRNQTRSILFYFVIAVATIPSFAFLCRGRTPSRFDAPNLPVWESQPPREAAIGSDYLLSPVPPGSIRLLDRSQVKALQKTNINALFASQEDSILQSRKPALETPGQWLEAACAYGRQEPALNTRQDQVALRLMALQNPDGYLGHETRIDHLSPDTLDRYSENICGLLAYYRITQNRSAIYAGIRAGDLALTLVSRMAKPEIGYELGSLHRPLLELYQATGDRRYLNVVNMASDTPRDGLTLALLYRATGTPSYLRKATALWAQQHLSTHPPATAFTAEMLKLTGLPCYATELAKTGINPIALKNVALTRAPGGIAANCPTDLEGVFGSVRLTQRVDREHQSTRLTVHTPAPTTFSLRLFVPIQPIPLQKSTLYGPPRLVVNSVPQNQVPRPGQYVEMTKKWKDGDTIALVPTPPTVTASVSIPAARDKALHVWPR